MDRKLIGQDNSGGQFSATEKRDQCRLMTAIDHEAKKLAQHDLWTIPAQRDAELNTPSSDFLGVPISMTGI